MPLRVALCGLGSAAERAHLPALLRAGELDGGVELVAVCDPSEPRRARAAQLLPGAVVRADLDELLAEVAPDLLVVASPPSSHLSAITAGLAASAHVVCEKPVGLSSGDVAALRRLHARHPEQALVSVHQYEHAAPWQGIAREIAEATAAGEEWRLGVAVERPGTDPLSAGGWRSQPETEGGILGDHAVHYLSMCWNLAPTAEVVACERHGRGGREHARVSLAAGRGRIDIDVSYAGDARRNRIHLERPAQRLKMTWDGSSLLTRRGDRESSADVDALSDRAFVNELYVPFYADVFAGVRDAAWRTRHAAETLGVARLLSTAIDTARVTEAEDSFMGDMRALARAVLLAFADLGIYLGSDRDRLILQARSLNPLDAGELAEFLDLCIAADLITPEQAGRLRLAPDEAKRLARSLEGSSPVPDDQAAEWVQQLGRTAPA